MNNDIMSLTNEIIYKGEMTASEEAAVQTLSINQDKLKNCLSWVRSILEDSTGVCFVNTDGFEKWQNEEGKEYIEPIKQNRKSFSIINKNSIRKPEFSSRKKRTELSKKKYEDLCISSKLDKDLAIYLVKSYLDVEVNPDSITIITPFNDDRAYIESHLQVKNFLVGISSGSAYN